MIKENLIFCQPLATTTKTADVKKLVNKFFGGNDLSWDIVFAICSDGAPAVFRQNLILVR